MKIALVGYGKMGKEIEKIAIARGHEVVLTIGRANWVEFTTDNLKKADAVIEFTTPEAAVSNIYKCFEAGVPVICGTTGWLNHYDEVKKACTDKGQAFFYASNYSIGVNMFFKLNEYLALLMSPYHNYKANMKEIHHVHKKDAPSGTAITLAEGIINNHEQYKSWALLKDAKPDDLSIEAKREGEVPGTHIIRYTSANDEISISHKANNRVGFAEGAVIAAEWLKGKKGVFGMNELLGM